MAVAQAYGKTVTSGSVFAYDVADTRNSYIGEPTTNIYSTDGFSFWQLDGNHTATRYTGNAPDLTVITNNYDYHTIVATGNWSNEVNRALLWTNSGLLQLNTQYAVSFYARVTSTSTANIGAAFYGNALPNSLTLTNEWQRFTVLTSTTATYRPFEFGSKSGAITFQIAGLQYEAKSHSTPYINGTRSATQGLLPLVGNSTLNLSNVSFDSNAQMVFDGTNDYVDCGAVQPFDLSARTVTWEAIVKFNNPSGAEAIITRWNNSTGEVWWFGRYATTKIHLAFIIGGGYYGYYSDGDIGTSAGYYHVAVTLNNTVLSYYINGVLDSTDTVEAGTWTSDPDPNLLIGAQNQGAASNLNGEIPVTKIYNRALSAAEVKQNYDFYNSRFAIEYDTYYFTVSNRAARVCRRHWNGSGFDVFKGKNMAATTPAYILYSKPNISFDMVSNYTEIARNDIGTPARPTVFGPQTSYSNGRYLTDVIVYKGKRGGPLRFEFPNGGTSQYGENFYKSIITPYVS